MKASLYLEYARKTMQAYEMLSKPLCKEIGMPQTAFDILMFLANHPSLNTAKDIVEIRGLKANHVSINVEKLVKDGYLERSEDKQDRRRVILSCTDKADPIIENGRDMQEQFYEKLLLDIPPESLDTIKTIMMKIMHNIDKMWGE